MSLNKVSIFPPKQKPDRKGGLISFLASLAIGGALPDGRASALFVTQRHQRIDFSCAPCRDVTSKQSDAGQHQGVDQKCHPISRADAVKERGHQTSRRE